VSRPGPLVEASLANTSSGLTPIRRSTLNVVIDPDRRSFGSGDRQVSHVLLHAAGTGDAVGETRRCRTKTVVGVKAELSPLSSATVPAGGGPATLTTDRVGPEPEMMVSFLQHVEQR